MNDTMIKISDVSKQYRLGAIGGTTLRDDLQRLSAKLRKKEDPTRKIGQSVQNYGERFLALDGVSFEVKRGEAVGIIGHNGAGKSTLLKLITRVTAPTSGYIGLNGRVASMLEVGTGFHSELTGRENIYMNGAILGMSRKEIDEKLEQIIEFSEVRDFIDTPVKRYSSGMYVKLAFSVAAHLDSEIVIMDEVLAVGDMAFQKKCLDKMRDAAKSEGRTVLYVSHNMNTIRRLCDRCVVLNQGKVEYIGDVDEAIALYMGKKGLSTGVIDLKALTREREFSRHPITMTAYRSLDNNDGGYQLGTSINACISAVAECDFDAVCLRLIIKSTDGTPVTMATSPSTVRFEKGKTVSVKFNLDISMLVPGNYTLSPVFYEVDEYGTNISLDVLRDAVVFSVKASDTAFNNSMEWQTKYWGYFRGKDITMTISEEERDG